MKESEEAADEADGAKRGNEVAAKARRRGAVAAGADE